MKRNKKTVKNVRSRKTSTVFITRNAKYNPDLDGAFKIVKELDKIKQKEQRASS